MEALEHFANAGLLTCTNVCLSRDLVRSGDLWHYFDLARDLGVGLIQLLEPRPCGGFRGQAVTDLLGEEERRLVRAFVREGNSHPAYGQHPLLYDLAEVERSPLIGCTMGGLSHFSIDTAGQVIPCVFAHVSFGSILDEDLAPILARMRAAVPKPIHGGCPSELLQAQLEALTSGHPGRTPEYRDLDTTWHQTLYGPQNL